MAAFLKSFEERLDCDSVHLKGLLTEEIKKRKAYQNGYYEAVAKNADLVEQLEKTRQSEAQKQCKDANAVRLFLSCLFGILCFRCCQRIH